MNPACKLRWAIVLGLVSACGGSGESPFGVDAAVAADAAAASVDSSAGTDTAVASDSSANACHYQTDMDVFRAAELEIVLPDGALQSCSAIYARDAGSSRLGGRVSGRVTATTADEVSLDTCKAGDGCSPSIYRFRVTAPGLTLSVPVGREVTISWTLSGTWYCYKSIVVFDGVVGDTDQVPTAPVWLAVRDGSPSSLRGAFTLELKELFCNPNPDVKQGCGGNSVAPDDYAFRFMPASGGAPLELASGQSGQIAFTTVSGLQHVLIRNIRSFQTRWCDDYWRWAWWATAQAGPDGAPN
jgi:hypothetical protein